MPLFSLLVLFFILLPQIFSALPPGCSPVGSVAGCTTWDATKYCFGCIAGYYPSGTGGCYPNNCASCSSAGQCGTCLTSFVAISGACTACPGNCDVCSSGSVCTTCSASYKIYQNLCYNPCPATTYTSGLTCQACSPNCNTCSSSSVCTVCSSSYYLYQNACGGTCPITTFISGSVCAACGSNCDVCTSSTVCTTCTSGYKKYQNQCYLNCPIKTFTFGTTCQDCSSNCDTCSDSSTCTGCSSGYYLYNSACYNPCPSKTVISGPNCVNCPSNCDVCSSSSICTTCSSGFYLYNGVCYNPCPTTTYQSSSSACSNCPSHCDVCSDGSTCTTCSSSYRLYLSQCYNPCPVTTYPASTTTCSNCPSNCDTCSDSSTCTACSSGYYLYNTVCYNPCPVTTFQSSTSACSNCPSHCDVCSDGSTCTTCSSGYRLYLGQCYNPCPVTTYPASTTTCSNCPSHCDTCIDSSTCTACSLNYRLYLSQCYNPCPVTTFPNGNICSNCPSHCDVCSDGTTCTTCSFGYKLYKSQCYGTCPLTTYTLGTNCLDCSSYCDTCVDSNSCTVCTFGYYFYQSKCYIKCPSQAPYISPTVTPYLCFKTCPTATPYNYENLCLAQCPDEAPYLIDNVCHTESFIEKIVKLGNTAASAASTGLIARSVASFSNPSLFMFGSLMKLLEYTRYMNISHSDNLEILFQTISDTGDFIPMPSMSDEMQNALESHPMPDVFARYDVPSNFLLNEGDDLLALLTILSLFAMFWIMQKGVYYLRNLKHTRSLVTNARFFFQNYVIGKFYEMLGDVALAAVFEFKTFSSSDRYSWLSLTACISCLVLGCLLYGINFWLIYASQKKKRENTESLKEFAEKYKGAEILFDSFKDESFLHQAAMLFFIARYILSSLIIAIGYEIPLFQSALLLILSFFMVVYYVALRPVKSRLEFTEQVSFELLLLAVNGCFFIQAMCDVMQASTKRVVYSIGQTVIVLNTAFKFLPLLFLAIQLGLTLWEYYKLVKNILKSEKTEKKKKKRICKPSRSNSSVSPESSHSSLQTSSGMNNSIIVHQFDSLRRNEEKSESPLLNRRLIKRNLKPKSLAIRAANNLPEAQKREQIREVIQKSTLFKDL